MRIISQKQETFLDQMSRPYFVFNGIQWDISNNKDQDKQTNGPFDEEKFINPHNTGLGRGLCNTWKFD